jgi:hypothetical protein
VWLERVEKDEEEAGARLKRTSEGRERAWLSHRDRGRWRDGGMEGGRKDEEKRRERARGRNKRRGGDRPAGLMRLTGGG